VIYSQGAGFTIYPILSMIHELVHISMAKCQLPKNGRPDSTTRNGDGSLVTAIYMMCLLNLVMPLVIAQSSTLVHSLSLSQGAR
jgi:hypothetical protein